MMFRLILSAAIILTITIHQFVQLVPIEASYYWRDYTGVIPSDAVSAGKDSSDRNVYIGQVYTAGNGLIIVVQITPGDEKYKQHIKILCGRNQEDFRWLSTSAWDFHKDLKDKVMVIGGHDDDWGDYYIGRVDYDGGIKVGIIDDFYLEESPMYFIGKGGDTKHTYKYDVLYLENSTCIDCDTTTEIVEGSGSAPGAGSWPSGSGSGVLFAVLVSILLTYS